MARETARERREQQEQRTLRRDNQVPARLLKLDGELVVEGTVTDFPREGRRFLWPLPWRMDPASAALLPEAYYWLEVGEGDAVERYIVRLETAGLPGTYHVTPADDPRN